MKIILLNGSPRKSWNTAELLNQAAEGAKSVGAEVEMVNLYDLKFTGCKSCFACKVKGSKNAGHCMINDDLKPVLEKIDEADGIILGSPIYFSDITAEARAFFERLMFQVLNYEGQPFTDGKLRVGCIYTMNAPDGYMNGLYQKYAQLFGMFYIYVGTVASTETLQVKDYGRFYLNSAMESARKARREKQFPVDLQNAYELGKKIAQQS